MPTKGGVSQNELRVVMALNQMTLCFLLCLGFAKGIEHELRTRLEGCQRIKLNRTRGISVVHARVHEQGDETPETR